MAIDTNLYIKPGQLRPLGIDRQQQRKLLNFVRGLQRLENKFFLLLGIHYFSRGEKDICQNAAFVLARVLSSRFGLPISNRLSDGMDHIEITIGIYAPSNPVEAFHQTFLRVFIAGKVLYIDPTYLFLLHDRKSIILREYPREAFWGELTREFKIEPYDPEHRAYQFGDILGGHYPDRKSREEYVRTSLELLHDPRILREGEKTLVGFDLGEWQRMDRVIRSLEPRAGLPPLGQEMLRVAGEYGIGHLLIMCPRKED